jgi:hypothetical protein
VWTQACIAINISMIGTAAVAGFAAAAVMMVNALGTI